MAAIDISRSLVRLRLRGFLFFLAGVWSVQRRACTSNCLSSLVTRQVRTQFGFAVSCELERVAKRNMVPSKVITSQPGRAETVR